MNTQLSDRQIQSYREDGWIHCPGFLDADEVAELKGAVLDDDNQNPVVYHKSVEVVS